MNLVTVSIVSHQHGQMLPGLMSDLLACPEVFRIILTNNIPEPFINIDPDRITVLNNSIPKGFGENHNAASKYVETTYFAVVNPDIRLDGNPFPGLIECIDRSRCALCAPAVQSPDGSIEDSARSFPTISGLALKLFGKHDGRLSYDLESPPMRAPWVAGMFMLFRYDDYFSINGFDEDYFLYYEDVDICARLLHVGKSVMLCPEVHVIHDARRASRHDPRHMMWHAKSMARYFYKHTLRSLKRFISV